MGSHKEGASVTPLDLFGEEIIGPVGPLPPSVKGKRKTKLNGYAAPPGSGPKGERCNTCINFVRHGGHARHYLKCLLMRPSWTSGPGTDILAKSPACLHWKKQGQ